MAQQEHHEQSQGIRYQIERVTVEQWSTSSQHSQSSPPAPSTQVQPVAKAG